MTESTQVPFSAYRKRFRKRLYEEAASSWARDNILWGVIVLLVPPLAVFAHNKHASLDWSTIRPTLWFYAVTFVIYLAVRCGQTAWKLDTDCQNDINGIREEITALQQQIDEDLERNDAPQIVLRWEQTREQQAYPGLGMTSKFLHIENRSLSEDVFNVQIEDSYLTDLVKASFKAVPVIHHGSTVRVDPRFNIHIEGHEHEFQMVIDAAGVDWKDLSPENYYRDSFSREHVRVPIYIAFARFNGKRYRAKFFFDFNIDTYEETISFVEVRPFRPPL